MVINQFLWRGQKCWRWFLFHVWLIWCFAHLEGNIAVENCTSLVVTCIGSGISPWLQHTSSSSFSQILWLRQKSAHPLKPGCLILLAGTLLVLSLIPPHATTWAMACFLMIFSGTQAWNIMVAPMGRKLCLVFFTCCLHYGAHQVLSSRLFGYITSRLFGYITRHYLQMCQAAGVGRRLPR